MKYRLKKKYPGLPDNWVADMIIKFGNDCGNKTYYFPENEQFTCLGLTKNNVENHPEYWEEVKEETYKIMSFRSIYQRDETQRIIQPVINGGITTRSHPFKSIESVIDDWVNRYKTWEIYSVKRLSDGEVFTIGDNVVLHSSPYILMTMRINRNSIYCTGMINPENELSSRFGQNIETLQQGKIPLFTTQDDVQIFSGDRYWAINRFSLLNSINGGYWSCITDKLLSENIIFSTAKAREHYILMNKPCLSINDITYSLKYAYVNNDMMNELKELVKAKNDTK